MTKKPRIVPTKTSKTSVQELEYRRKIIQRLAAAGFGDDASEEERRRRMAEELYGVQLEPPEDSS